jgi:hypothetical protein
MDRLTGDMSFEKIADTERRLDEYFGQDFWDINHS